MLSINLRNRECTIYATSQVQSTMALGAGDDVFVYEVQYIHN
jgi:hypothetical protein